MKRLALLVLLLSAHAFAQQNGQPATDVLGSSDLNGNPAFMGGVTNGGPNAHSVW
jgi:hypothetical protein